jgi:hypothetical protein
VGEEDVEDQRVGEIVVGEGRSVVFHHLRWQWVGRELGERRMHGEVV